MEENGNAVNQRH